MYEYGIIHIDTNRRTIIYGYNFYDACEKARIKPQDWEIDYCEYVD
jgi:hypothetical protein